MGADGRVPDLAVVSGDVDLRTPLPFPLEVEALGLVVEVVSTSSRTTDRAEPEEYGEAGIELCWRVETAPHCGAACVRAARRGLPRVDRVDGEGEGDLPVPWQTLRPRWRTLERRCQSVSQSRPLRTEAAEPAPAPPRPGPA